MATIEIREDEEVSPIPGDDVARSVGIRVGDEAVIFFLELADGDWKMIVEYKDA